jgi:hypothetical protein
MHRKSASAGSELRSEIRLNIEERNLFLRSSTMMVLDYPSINDQHHNGIVLPGAAGGSTGTARMHRVEDEDALSYSQTEDAVRGGY